VRDALNHVGHVSIGEPNRIGQSRREALGLARADGYESFLYCDFDRWLHWAESYPEELSTLPAEIHRRQPEAWYVCLGRSPRAFATHPRVQRVTEARSNQVISLLTGRTLDATAGACWIARPAADIVLSESIETSNATDLEWPALIAVRDRGRLGSRRVEGLEFETATFHQRDIRAAGGLEAWLARHYDRQDVWEVRTQLMTESVRAALRVFDGAAMNALSCD
jgi:hypothetical protein